MTEDHLLIETLIAGCVAGERKAQELLYDRFCVSMAAICMRYTKNKENALEILNDGFLKVFKNIHRFDPVKASLYTWMRTIMINTAIDFLKRQQPVNSELRTDDEEETAIDNEVLLKINADALLAMIRKLPPATHAVFTLFTVDGYSHREVAAILGISEGTSKWHLSDARRQLKQLIKMRNE